jgi:ATP-dependent Lhr-like helicase
LADDLTLDRELRVLVEEKPALLDFSKWGIYLPIEYKVQVLKEWYFDFTEAANFITYKKLV